MAEVNSARPNSLKRQVEFNFPQCVHQFFRYTPQARPEAALAYRPHLLDLGLAVVVEPGRPGRAPGYFLRPYGLARVPELRVDLWEPPDTDPTPLTPLAGLEHPEVERFQGWWAEGLRSRLVGRGDAGSLLQALRLEPTDGGLLRRLLGTPLTAEAFEVYKNAMRELDLPLPAGLRAPA